MATSSLTQVLLVRTGGGSNKQKDAGEAITLCPLGAWENISVISRVWFLQGM